MNGLNISPFHCSLKSSHETYAETRHNYVCFINDYGGGCSKLKCHY